VKRDPEIIRNILLEFLESDLNCFQDKLATGNSILVKGVETNVGRQNQIRAEHIRWMIDDGLLQPLENAPVYVRVTAKGCDFAESIQDEGIWARTKNVVAETGGSVSIEIIKALAIGLMKKKVSKHTGIELL